MKVVIKGWLWVLAILDSTKRGHPVFTAQETSSHPSQGTRRRFYFGGFFGLLGSIEPRLGHLHEQFPLVN
jgi:hypothetical protein